MMKGEPSSIYYVLRFFVGAATTLLLALLVLGVRVPRVAEYRKTRVAKYLLFVSLLVLGAPILLYKIFRVTAVNMFMSYLSDSICYVLMMYAPVLLLSDRYGQGTRWLLVAAAPLCAVMQAYFLLCYPLFGIVSSAAAWVFFGMACVLVVYLSYSGLAFFRRCGNAKTVWWTGAYFFFLVAVIVYYQILLPSFPGLDDNVIYMKVLFTVVSALFIIKFFDYASQLRSKVAVADAAPAVDPASEQDALPALSPDIEAALKERLDRWVEERRFLDQDEGIDLVAAQLGTDLKTLRTYFRTRMPSDFRTWRISLRIEFAKERLREDPEISVNRLSEMSGFTTRSNFYHYFKKITGMTPAEYKERLS